MMNQMTSTKGNLVPTPDIEYQYVWMKHELFNVILIMVATGILFCVLCLAVITRFLKKHLIFLSSGVRLTYLFVCGCAMVLLSLPLFGIDSQVTPFLNIRSACMARIWLLNVGFSLSVGIMIVRVIYTTIVKLDTSKKHAIPTSIILYLVLSLATIDSLIVIAWRLRSPPHKDYAIKEVELIGLRDKKITLVENCKSEKESLLVSVFCFYKGLLVLVAFLLSIFWKKEEETKNHDFQQSKGGLLSVLLTGFVVLPVVLSLPHYPNISFGVGGVLVTLEVGFLMFWIICNKMIKAYLCRKGEAREFGHRYAIKGQTRIPCIHTFYGCATTEELHQFHNEAFEASEVGFSLHFQSGTIKPDSETTEDEMNAFGFDFKESEDYLPSDFSKHDDFNLEAFQPTEEAEDEECDDDYEENAEKNGNSSDDSSSDSSDSDSGSEGEQQEKDTSVGFSRCTLEKSNVSVRTNKSTKKQEISPRSQVDASFNTAPPNTEQLPLEVRNSMADTRPTTTSSDNVSPNKNNKWWKPLFGVVGLFKAKKKGSQQSIDNSGSEQDEYESETNGSYSSSESESESGSETERE